MELDLTGLSRPAQLVLMHLIRGDDPVAIDERLAMELAFWSDKHRNPYTNETPLDLYHEDDVEEERDPPGEYEGYDPFDDR